MTPLFRSYISKDRVRAEGLLLAGCGAGLFLYFLPLLVLRGESCIWISDMLDLLPSRLLVLARSGKILSSDSVIEQVMNNLPRSSLPSGLYTFVWLFALLPPLPAFILGYIIVHIMGFIGMYLLLRKHILRDDRDLFVVAVSSFCFALLPFNFVTGGLSVSGQPLLLYAVLNLRRGEGRLRDCLIIVLFAFSSSLVLVGIFILASFSVWFVLDFIFYKKVNYGFMSAILLLGGSYLVMEWALIRSIFIQNDILSHRTERDFVKSSIPINLVMRKVVGNFFFGQYHASSLQGLIALAAVPLALINGSKHPKERSILRSCLIISILFSLSYGFFEWRGLISLKQNFGLLTMVNFGRFHFLQPLLWYIIFALALSLLSEPRKGPFSKGSRLVIFIVIAQTLIITGLNPEYKHRLINSFDRLRGNAPRHLTYNQFYSQELFNEVRTFIGKPQSEYRVISIGLHPAVSQYNGFYTLDSYEVTYPLKYKHKFREIIAKELEKNVLWKEYFDDWGNRCYAFADEIPFKNLMVHKHENMKLNNLNLDTDTFKAMGGEYILSAADITNFEENQLTLLKVFENNASPWRIFLYRAN